MADSDSTAPKLADDAQLQKARDILSGMSSRRLDPATIKITETQTGKKGGQGVVVIGTLNPPEALKEWFPELKVAVKKLEWKRDDAEESAKFFKSFVNELALMASLSHPNIVMLVGFVEDMHKGDAWMILPWEANGNVREFLQTGEWDMPERISLIQDTAKGLEYLHHQQPPVCHGDLKSFNILVNSSYRAVITDFGSARIRQSLASEKNENEGAGAPIFEDADTGSIPPKVQFNVSTMELTLTGPKFSLRWTAPEVLNNGIQNLPSDVWALGWVCWEVVTGRIPFEDLNRESVIIVHAINGRLPAIREDAGLSQVLQLCSLISDCWLLDPTKRINVSGFWQKVQKMPSVVPSSYSVGDQKIRSANLLIQLGKTYSLQDDQVMAESYARSALDVANRTKNALAKANALDCLGDIYSAQSKNSEAEEAFMKAHEIYSRLGNDLGAANALEGLGNTYYPQSRHQEAEKAFTEAHEIHSRIGNHMGAANTLLGLGNIYTVHLRYPEAEKAFMEGHKIHSRIGDDRGAANALLGLGNIYVPQSRDQESEKAFTEAYEIYTRIGNHMGVGNALHGLGESYVAQMRVQEAEKAFTESHEIHSRIGSHIGVADALSGLGRVYAFQSRCQESEKVLTESYEIHNRIDNHLGAARTLSGLYALYISQSRDQDAERVHAKALEIYSHIDNLGSGS